MKYFNMTVLILITVFAINTNAQFTLENAFPNLSFSNAVFLTDAGDGTNRLFVVDQTGKIRVFENSQSVNTSKEFLNITDRVSSGGEMGLLGLAFHPDYESNGYFYVNYTASSPRRTIISRFEVSATNPDSANKNSELEILVFNQPYSNHNGGWIGFGPNDGYLYIGTGDGGSGGDPENNGQRVNTLLGKILRIDVDNPDQGLNYGIPLSNPFIDSSGAVRKEIYAWGLRNPWRCSFDDVTGLLFAGDVGQNAWEEIDVIENGKNYGWRCYEGNHNYNTSGCNYPEYIDPVWEYSHSLGYSVTGGYVYRGPTVPELDGKYIYADYGSKRIWSLEYDGINPPVNNLLLTGPSSITSFGQDENKELYIVSFSSIRKFTPTVTINAPTNLDGLVSITLGVPPMIIVDLTWDDNSNDEDGFRIERKEGNGNFIEIATVGANVTDYTDMDLLDLTQYSYRVMAYNQGGNSGYSNIYSFVSPARVEAPSNLIASAISPFEVQVNWSDNSMEDGFKIERRFVLGQYSLIDSVGPDVTSYLDNTVNPASIYYYRVYAHQYGINSAYSNEDSAKTPLLVGIENETTPKDYKLEQNYPNPFNPSTVIKFSLPEESFVTVVVYNSIGKEVTNLVNENLQAGNYEQNWNGDGLSSGVYYLRVQAESLSSEKQFINVIKMMYLK